MIQHELRQKSKHWLLSTKCYYMTNSTDLSCSALWNLLHSLFQDKFTGGASPFLHTSQGLSFHFQLQVPTLPYCRVETFFYFNSCGAVFWVDKGGHFFASTLTCPSDVASGAQRPLSPFLCAWLPVIKMCRTSPSQPWCWNLCVFMRCWYQTSSAST